VVFKFTLIMNS